MSAPRLRINTQGTQKTAGGVNKRPPAEEPEASPPLMPITSEADIDYSLVYALHTFVANLEGQVCVLKGDSLELLDDSNSYWWLVKCLKTQEIGYIPAENIETPNERLARLNSQRNIDTSAPTIQDALPRRPAPHKKKQRLQISDGPPDVFSSDVEDNDPNDQDAAGASLADDPRYEYEYDPDDEQYANAPASGIYDSLARTRSSQSGNADGDAQRSESGGKKKLWGLFKLKDSTSSISFGSLGRRPSQESVSAPQYVPQQSQQYGPQAGTMAGPPPSGSLPRPPPGVAPGTSNGVPVAPRGSSVRGQAALIAQQAQAAVQAQSRLCRHRRRIMLRATLCSADIRLPVTDTVTDAAAHRAAPAAQPGAINVLRIYTGNVDLEATFKSVSFTETMSASELVEGALKKFRVPGANPRDFHLSVLHMDSQERRLEDSDVVFNVLESLRQRQLPGIGDFSRVAQSYGNRGNVSTVRSTDDNVIRVIINKRPQEATDSLLRPIRVAYMDLVARQKIYRTVGVPRSAKTEDALEIALQAFGMQPGPDEEYIMCSLINNNESILLPGEPIIPIIRVAEQRGQDLTFLLRRDKATLPRPPPVDEPNVECQQQEQQQDLRPTNQPLSQSSQPLPIQRPPTQIRSQAQQPQPQPQLQPQPQPQQDPPQPTRAVDVLQRVPTNPPSLPEPRLLTPEGSIIEPLDISGQYMLPKKLVVTNPDPLDSESSASPVATGAEPTDKSPAAYTAPFIVPPPRKSSTGSLERKSQKAPVPQERPPPLVTPEPSMPSTAAPSTPPNPPAAIAARNASSDSPEYESPLKEPGLPSFSVKPIKMSASANAEALGSAASPFPASPMSEVVPSVDAMQAALDAQVAQAPGSQLSQPSSDQLSPPRVAEVQRIPSPAPSPVAFDKAAEQLSRAGTGSSTSSSRSNLATPPINADLRSASPVYGSFSQPNPVQRSATTAAGPAGFDLAGSEGDKLKGLQRAFSQPLGGPRSPRSPRPALPGASAFEMMVDYLDEILKENADERRVQQFEKDLNIDSPDRRMTAVDRLKRRSLLGGATSEPNLAIGAPASQSSAPSGAKAAAQARSALAGGAAASPRRIDILFASQTSSPPRDMTLKDVLNDIEVSIEEILRRGIERDSERRRSARSSSIVAIAQARDSMLEGSKAEATPARFLSPQAAAAAFAAATSSTPSSAGTLGPGPLAAFAPLPSFGQPQMLDDDEDEIDTMFEQFKATEKSIDTLDKMICSLLEKSLTMISPLTPPAPTLPTLSSETLLSAS
ncbi:protein phosphatase regulator [Polyrhizophydium stewartii]|uniref:Protein phosphatase regulator n=1 Tax=Polyrhizophydium stewartii TaxID=2732419 RepID=A0ABR4NA32_9FUNG